MSILKGTREHVWSAVMKTTGRLQQWHLHSIALYGLKIATFLEQVLRHGRPIALSCILRDSLITLWLEAAWCHPSMRSGKVLQRC